MEGGLHAELMQRGDVRLRGPARCRGVLYDLGPYPGMVPGGRRWVAGELYRLDDPASLFALLDDIEREAGFERKITEVEWRHGPVAAWAWHYARPPGDAPVIPGGSWRAHVRRSKGPAGGARG